MKVHTLEPQPTVASKDFCQVKQYTHITKNGIQWYPNPSTVQVGGKYFKINYPWLKKIREQSPVCNKCRVILSVNPPQGWVKTPGSGLDLSADFNNRGPKVTSLLFVNQLWKSDQFQRSSHICTNLAKRTASTDIVPALLPHLGPFL